MEYQDELRTLITALLHEKRPSGRPRYTLRQLARRLEMNPPSLSEMLARKREITTRMARRILGRLPVSQEVIQEFEKKHRAVLEKREGRRHGKEIRYTPLDSDGIAVVSQWQYLAVLSLAETRDFCPDPAWISRRLGISQRKARLALQVLERLGGLKRDDDGNLRPSGKAFITTDGIASDVIRRSHEETLDLAVQSLQRDAVSRRYFTSTTMAVNPARIEEGNAMIRRFRDRLCRFLEGGGEKLAVYRIALCLFPLTTAESEMEIPKTIE